MSLSAEMTTSPGPDHNNKSPRKDSLQTIWLIVYLTCAAALLSVLYSAHRYGPISSSAALSSKVGGVVAMSCAEVSVGVLRQLAADPDAAAPTAATPASPVASDALAPVANNAANTPLPWMLPAGAVRFVQAVRDDPVTRQLHWWECLASSLDPACVPEPAARDTVLTLSEWKAHTLEMLGRTRRFRGQPPFVYFNPKYNSSKYEGPWVENEFIRSFLDTGKMELFYPLVPLFVQWTDVLLGDAARASELQTELLTLRSDVLYVTVTQMDRVPAASQLGCAAMRNVLAFSASGWGSVPIPLIKGFKKPHNHHYWPPSTDPVKYHRRKFVMAFIGEEKLHGHDAYRKALKSATFPLESSMIYNHDMWQWMVHGVIFVVSQRGYDRAAYRTVETLQYGRIVVLLYNDGDMPWTPYQHVADFVAPSEQSSSSVISAPASGERYGAVLLNASAHAASSSSDSEPSIDPSLWTRVLNDGGLWGPGGVGFAVSYGQLESFTCVACEFIKPGSAAVWRHVRTLPLHMYGKGADQECPCSSAAAWRAAAALLPGPSTLMNMSLPEDSLVYEMERRVLGVTGQYFTYDAVMAQIEAYVVSPAGAALKCVPRPAMVQPFAGGGTANSARGV